MKKRRKKKKKIRRKINITLPLLYLSLYRFHHKISCRVFFPCFQMEEGGPDSNLTRGSLLLCSLFKGENSSLRSDLAKVRLLESVGTGTLTRAQGTQKLSHLATTYRVPRSTLSHPGCVPGWSWGGLPREEKT